MIGSTLSQGSRGLSDVLLMALGACYQVYDVTGTAGDATPHFECSTVGGTAEGCGCLYVVAGPASGVTALNAFIRC